MVACRIITFEKTGHWAAALRPAGGDALPPVVETRGLAGCRAAMAQSPRSLLAIEVTAANLVGAQVLVLEIVAAYPRAVVMGLLATDAADAELLLREAGAVDVIGSVLEMPRVARLAGRLAAASPDEEAAVEEVLERLMPWPGLATPEWAAANL